jgi:hypothetical protein
VILSVGFVAYVLIAASGEARGGMRFAGAAGVAVLSLGPLVWQPCLIPTPNHTPDPPPKQQGLIFVAYCVVCYLITALLFSLLILDLAALVLTVAPSKGMFKYTDLVYTGEGRWVGGGQSAAGGAADGTAGQPEAGGEAPRRAAGPSPCWAPC